jgi:hypothetical protein
MHDHNVLLSGTTKKRYSHSLPVNGPASYGALLDAQPMLSRVYHSSVLAHH